MNLAELRALAKAATPGPYFMDFDDAHDAPPHRNAGLHMVDTGRSEDWPVGRLLEGEQARFVVAFTPETILALLDVAVAAEIMRSHNANNLSPRLNSALRRLTAPEEK